MKKPPVQRQAVGHSPGARGERALADFFSEPILNSPYAYPGRHWQLVEGRPTNIVEPTRRRSAFVSPVPRSSKQRGGSRRADTQGRFALGNAEVSTAEQEYDPNVLINNIRPQVDAWRDLRNPSDWGVTPETQRLLAHWRHFPFEGIRPFFCQVEAVETVIWLTEVAPRTSLRGRPIWEHIRGANEQANPELLRLALKLATGAGKTTVMAMLIAWQTVNAVRRPASRQYSRGFLIVTPGITIKDRLRVLQPNDPDSYFKTRELVPNDMLGDIAKAKIVITNYHAFKPRERLNLAAGTRRFLEGHDAKVQSTETEGQTIQRVMPELMGMRNIVVLNDEAHHCYREKVSDESEKATAEEKDEAKKNNEAARLWINGIEAVKRKLGIGLVFDLSATPFFLRGSGYVEGTLFPWTVSDFSLMDAIECGIVKLPRVPVADNKPGGDMPTFRELWRHISDKMPKKGRKKGGVSDALTLPTFLQSALDALYGHYAATFELWRNAGIEVPPVFIIVCNNTASSKLVYDYISGFERADDTGNSTFHNGRLPLFQNYDEHGNRLARPRTLLIDSTQIESDDAIDPEFRKAAAEEIEQFRREIVERTGDRSAGDKITDQALLREVMNTVGRKGRLGEHVRCVVSVSMLTEGWDANTVTHILGVRAFGTQLLCEQVVGRGLRRQSYELNEDGLFNVEYADILGIPFDFTAESKPAPPQKPRQVVHVRALRERAALEISFPRVQGYRVDLPEERLRATFTKDSVLELTPDDVGPSKTIVQGILGEGVELTVEHLDQMRPSTVLFHLAKHLLYTKYRDPGEEPKLHLFGQLKRIARQWMDQCLVCKGDTKPAQLLYAEMLEKATELIRAAITEAYVGEKVVKAILDPYNPIGSSRFVNFNTSKETRWQTTRSHVNWVVCDGDWEAELCRVVEGHPRVLAYVKNQGLGLEVPYLFKGTPRKYLPDFIVRVDDGRPDPLNLIVEIKGYRGQDARDKANTMRAFWVPGVNNLGKHGRWAFAEFTDVFEIEAEFGRLIESFVQKVDA